MMCARLLRARARRAARPPLPRARSASSTALQRGYDRALRWVLRHRVAHAASSRSARWRSPSSSSSIVPKGLFPQQDTGHAQRLLRRAAGHLVPGDEGAAGGAQRDRRWPIPTSTTSVSFIGGGGGVDGQHRHHVHRAQAAAASARRPPTRSSRACAPSSAKRRGHHPVPAVGAGRAHRRRGSRARSTSTRCRTPTSTSCSQWAPQRARRSCKQLPAAAGTWPPISRPPGLQLDVTIDRDTASRLGITPQDDRRHALRRLRPAPGGDHLHAAQPVPRGARGEARARSAAPTRSSSIYVRVADGRPGAARRARHGRAVDDARCRSTTRGSSRR